MLMDYMKEIKEFSQDGNCFDKLFSISKIYEKAPLK